MQRWKQILGVFMLALIWSPTFLLVRLGVETLPPATLTTVRCIMGGVTLLFFALVSGSKIRPMLSLWWPLLIAGVLMNALPHVLCAWGETYVDSSTAAILEGSVPMFLLLFAYFFLRTKEMQKREVFGVITGFVGLLIIFAPSMAKAPHEAMGLTFLVGMAASFAAGILYSSRKLKDIDPIAAVGMQMGLSSFVILPIALMFDKPWQLMMPSMQSLILLFVLSVICSATGWVLYYYLIRTIKASSVSLSTLLVPILALCWGVFLMKEPLTWYKMLGGLITLLSVALTLQSGKQPEKQKDAVPVQPPSSEKSEH